MRNFGEGAVAVVSQQVIWPEAGHIDIVPAVIIVIANRYPHAPSDVTYPGMVRYVGKRSIAIVVIESASGFLSGLHHVHCQRIHEIDIQIAIVVVIKELHAATH